MFAALRIIISNTIFLIVAEGPPLLVWYVLSPATFTQRVVTLVMAICVAVISIPLGLSVVASVDNSMEEHIDG